MPFSQLFFWVVPIVALSSYCLLMLFFAISQKDKFIRAFMLVLAALIIWTASALFMKMQMYPGVLFWNRLMVAGTIAVPFLLYCFVSVFTNSLNVVRTIMWGSLTVVAIIVDLLGYVVTKAGVIANAVIANGHQFTVDVFYYSLGTAAYPMYLLMFLMIIATLVKAKRSVRNGNIKYGQIGPITAGISIMFIGSLLNVVPYIGKYPVDILACFINAILIMVSIYKYRMLELRFMMTKGLVYSVFVGLLSVAYLFCAFFVENHFGTLYENMIPYFTTLTALAVAVFFQPLYKWAGKLVDKMFYKADYSQRQALRHFSSSISNKLDLNHIARELIAAVQLAMHARQVLVLIKNEEGKDYGVFQTSSQLYKPDLQISFENPIIGWLAKNKTGLSRDELYSLSFFKSMWEKEKRDLHDLDIDLIIPMRIGSDITGLLMLTGKKNNMAYTLDDMDLLNYLGTSTAVAFENARLYTRSQEEAVTDNLTKLHNHRYFYKALEEQMNKIGSAELSLIMLDLDSFKLYNDLYGHVEGDHALEMVARIMVEIVGQKGVVCRYGGEEFTVLLPYHDSKMAFDVAEKIRFEIQTKFCNDVTQRFLTASIGVCTYPLAAPNTQELLKRADLAMYTAKNQGKNQTVIYTPRVVDSGRSNSEIGEDKRSIPSYTATIYALTAAIDTKDHYTFGHSQRVAEYATILASNMALDDADIEILREAALLHDIGKIGIPEDILMKTGRLTTEEYQIMQKHSEMSITIIQHLPSLNYVIPAVLAHHEKWDGTGYPRGLKGDNIPLTARILTIADSFDAMTSNRPYRLCLSVSSALGEMANCMGTQFDPSMAKLFIKLVREGKIKVDQRIEMKNIV